jgi:hypothetical protein
MVHFLDIVEKHKVKPHETFDTPWAESLATNMQQFL